MFLNSDHTHNEVTVRLGAYDFFENEVPAFDMGVKDIMIHPDFTADGWHNDIALLRLATPATYSQSIRPLPLSLKGPVREEECAVVSWHHRRE